MASKSLDKKKTILSMKLKKGVKIEKGEEERIRKESIVENLKHINRKEILEIYDNIELIDDLEVKIYDSSNIDKFILENITNFELEFIKADPDEMQQIIDSIKSKFEQEERNIIEVVNPVDLTYKYFYKSSGKSREGLNLKGLYLPLDKIPLQFDPFTLSFRFLKPEDEFVHSMDETKYNSKNSVTLESIEKYSRFVNEINARICKTLYEMDLEKEGATVKGKKKSKKKKTKTKNKKVKVGTIGNNHKAVARYKSKKIKAPKSSTLSHSPSLYEVIRNSSMKKKFKGPKKSISVSKKLTPERLKLLKKAVKKAKENENKKISEAKLKKNAENRIKSLEEFRKLMLGNI